MVIIACADVTATSAVKHALAYTFDCFDFANFLSNVLMTVLEFRRVTLYCINCSSFQSCCSLCIWTVSDVRRLTEYVPATDWPETFDAFRYCTDQQWTEPRPNVRKFTEQSGSRRNADTERPFVAGTISVYYWTVPFLEKYFTDMIPSFNGNS
jgi:hypothetical protein